MNNSQHCFAEELISFFEIGAKQYLIASDASCSTQTRHCFRVLQQEKANAVQQLSKLKKKQTGPLLAASYESCDILRNIHTDLSSSVHLEDVIQAEHHLIECLKFQLRQLPPSELTLVLRQITNRHQQCLERLTNL